VPLALSTSHEIGLFTVAAIFIAFSLAASFLFPRWNPSFPGRRRNLFLVVVVVLTIAQLAAVEVWAKEDTKAEASPSETTTTSTSTTTAPAAPTGDAQAGKAVFTSAGCAACHTLTAANAKGTVGPNLDTSLKGKDAAFIRQSIVDPNAEITPGYQAGVMPDNFKDQLSATQLNDVVALLQQQT
jgi:mono/diheme cytochrome c family protein